VFVKGTRQALEIICGTDTFEWSLLRTEVGEVSSSGLDISASTVTLRNTPTNIRRTPSGRVTMAG
jgi:hypothetical protein